MMQKQSLPLEAFQSTLSAGRETVDDRIPWFAEAVFQSTPSVGRETRLGAPLALQPFQFQSTPSVGRETSVPQTV